LKKFKINAADGTFCQSAIFVGLRNKNRGHADEVESHDGNVVLTKWQENNYVFMG
jgi:hypothetical protein